MKKALYVISNDFRNSYFAIILHSKKRKEKKTFFYQDLDYQDLLIKRIPRFTTFITKCIKHLVISLFMPATISQRNFFCTLDHINSSSNVQRLPSFKRPFSPDRFH